jgi:hypothetical protein
MPKGFARVDSYIFVLHYLFLICLGGVYILDDTARRQIRFKLHFVRPFCSYINLSQQLFWLGSRCEYVACFFAALAGVTHISRYLSIFLP